MWKAATTSNVNSFEKDMLEMKYVSEEEFKHLLNIPPRFWSNSRSRPNKLCNTLVNNMSEAFNSIFFTTRAKPIITMIGEIIVYISC